MIGAVLSGHNGFRNACRSECPIWNKTAGIQVLITHAWSMTLQKENGDSGAESILCAAVCEA
jgi:hypothetical protein